MFVNLFKLINKVGDRTPLEDFTTECFAGILKNPDILKSYAEWLGLPKGDYKVFTQGSYLLDNNYCFIDLVIENQEVLCFIEHKVNSQAGHEQLERYIKLLDIEGSTRKTYLRYCTKKVDIKNHIEHHFQQFRWYDVANWLKKNHINRPLVQEFLNYLKTQQMEKDTSISTDTVITLHNFNQTLEAVKYHIEQAYPSFQNTFSNTNFSNRKEINDIRDFERISRYISPILEKESPHNELLYAIHFEEVKLQTQIWISIAHPEAEILLKKAEETGLFKHWKDDAGIGIFLDCKLYQFIDSDNSDQDILNWFIDSFDKFRRFIDSTPELRWNKEVIQNS